MIDKVVVRDPALSGEGTSKALSSKTQFSLLDVSNSTRNPPAEKSADPYPTVLRVSPWQKYEQDHERDMGGPLTVACQKSLAFDMVAVRELQSTTASDILDIIKNLQHENIVAVFELFEVEQSLFVVSEYLPITLHQIVKCLRYPNELQLAAILGQVIRTTKR